MQQYVEGQRARGPNGEVAVYSGGAWHVQGGAQSIQTKAPDPTRPDAIRRTHNEANASDLSPAQAAANLEATRLGNQEKRNKLAEAAAAQRIVPSSTVHGPAYLNTVPENMRGIVAGVVQGRIPLPANALRTPYWQQVLAHATNMDPKFDAVNFNARSAARKEFTSGPDGASLTALETALLHEGQVKTAAGALNNWNSPIVNSVRDAYLHVVGDGRLSDFENKREAYVGEKQKVFVPTNGTEGDRIAARNQLPLNASPDSFDKVFRGDATLYRSRLEALQAKYQRAMGTTADITDLLSPEAQRTYADLTGQKSGSIPFGGVYGDAGSAPGGGPPPPGGGGQMPPGHPGGPPPVISGSPHGGNPGLQNLLNSYTGNGRIDQVAAGALDSYRNQFDPKLSGELNTLIRAGKSPDEINTYLKSRGADPVDAAGILAAQAYLKGNPGYKASVGYATKSIPNTMWERISGSPVGAAVAGYTDGVTAGWSPQIAGRASQLFGGDYEKTRDRVDANETLLAQSHPIANLAGNAVGGAALMVGGDAIAGAKAASEATRLFPSIVRRGAQGIKDMGLAPAVGDAAYGGSYGLAKGGGDPIRGLEGAGAALAGGGAARGMLGMTGSAIAPTGGKLAPLYEQGVFPTIGQRAAASSNPAVKYLFGKPLNAIEQLSQSLPGLGFLPYRARSIPRDAFEVGGYNKALEPIGGALPSGTGPGSKAFDYTKGAFDDAYDQARSGMQFSADPQYHQDLSAFHQQLGDGTLTAPQAAQVRQRIDTAVHSRLQEGMLPGDAYKAAASDLGRTADAWSGKPETALQADALGDYSRNVFDAAARRNSDPAAVAAMDRADKGYAMFARIRSAANSGSNTKGPGRFTPTDLIRADRKASSGVQNSSFHTGDSLMGDYAQAGTALNDTIGDSGTAPRMLLGAQLGLGTGAEMAGLGPLLLKAAPVTLPYAPGVNYALTRAMAPRSALGIDPNLASAINVLGTKIKGRAGMFGSLAAPTAADYAFQP